MGSKFFKKLFHGIEKNLVRPVVKNVAPIVGSAAGTFLGGPFGAVIGGALGGSTQRGGHNKFSGALKGAGIGLGYSTVAPMVGQWAGLDPVSPGFLSSVTGLNKPSLLYQLGVNSAPGIGGGLGLFGNVGTSGVLESLSPSSSSLLGMAPDLLQKVGSTQAAHSQNLKMQELLRQQQEDLANEAAFSHGTGLSQRSPGGPLHSLQDLASDVSYSMPAPDLHTAALLAQLRPRRKAKSLHESLTEASAASASSSNTNPFQRYSARGSNPLGHKFSEGGSTLGFTSPPEEYAQRGYAGGGFIRNAYNRLKPYAPYIGGALGAAALGGLGAIGQSNVHQEQDFRDRSDNFFENAKNVSRNSDFLGGSDFARGIGNIPLMGSKDYANIPGLVSQLSRAPETIGSINNFSTTVPSFNISRVQNPNYQMGEITNVGNELFGSKSNRFNEFDNLEKHGLVQDNPFFNKRLAKGGFVNPNHHGYIKEGDTGGQDDDVDMVIPQGSYVMNATDVSLLGDGSSENGAKKLMNLESGISRRHLRAQNSLKNGGMMRAKVSNDEYVLHPETVNMLGNGDNQRGAKVLDKMRKNLRIQKGVKKILPPKSKAVTSYMPKAGRYKGALSLNSKGSRNAFTQ